MNLESLFSALFRGGLQFLFTFLHAAGETVPALAEELDAGLLVVDQAPLRLPQQWKEAVKEKIKCPMHEVDAHNIVPVRAS
jgi:DNA photolyase